MEQGAAPHADSRSWRVPSVIASVAIAVGIALRAIEFWRDRPLWLDEAMLALNIASRPFGELGRRLDYDQTAPLLYLWAERLAVTLGGVSERTLRLLPFVAGVALLPAVWFVARRLANPAAAAVATVLAALSLSLVSFSAEAKQYGVDPAATLVAVWLAANVVAAPDDRRAWTRLGVGGVVCLLVSHPALFTLGGATAALALDPRVRRSGRWRPRVVVLAMVWAAAFAVLYFAMYRATAESAYMQRFWAGTFLDPRAADFGSRVDMFATAIFAAPTLAGMVSVPVAALALAWIGGVWAMWRENRFASTVVAVPVLLAIGASAIGKYPVVDRLFLFAAPLTMLAYACLVARALGLVPARARSASLAAACAALAMLVGPTHVRRVANPVFYGVGKQIVADVDSMSHGEPVYIAARSFPLWLYYTTDWRTPDIDRLRWAARVAGDGAPAHNNAPSRGRVGANEGAALVRRYRGRMEIVGIPTGRQYVASTRTMDPALPASEYALPLQPDSGWAELEVRRMAALAQPRLWIFGSHMFGLDGAEPGLVAELQRRGVRLVMERRQGTTVAYRVEFPDAP